MENEIFNLSFGFENLIKVWLKGLSKMGKRKFFLTKGFYAVGRYYRLQFGCVDLKKQVTKKM
jgi:hypothetical protein